jgi:DNA (cytosine-5)-methyltransferase 1
MFEQLDLFSFDKEKLKIKKPVRLIELFAGIGSQAMALRDLGIDFEHYMVVEFDRFAIASYNAIHGTNFNTIDIREMCKAMIWA